MTKFLNAFLEFKNEDSVTKKVGLMAFLGLTASLAILSVSGAIASSTGDWGYWIIRAAFSSLIFCAETLAAVIFVRAVLASKPGAKTFGGWLWGQRKAIICLIIWIGLSWTCVQNAKVGAHTIFPDRFDKTATLLTAESGIANADATAIDTVKQKAIEEAPKELERVRTQIADLTVFQKSMSAMTPEGIKAAQSEMIPRCGYTGRVDGIRNVLTEAAMRRCGEKISGELDILKARENALSTGQFVAAAPAVAGGGTTDPRIRKAELDAAADKAWWDAFKLEVMLWVLELARSMGLWAAFTSASAANLHRGRDREEELAEAEHQAKLRKVNGEAQPEPVPEPKPAETPPAPISEPVASPEPVAAVVEPLEPETPAAPIPGRAGGLAAGHTKAAAKAKAANVILVGDWEERDAEAQAAKVAAQ